MKIEAPSSGTVLTTHDVNVTGTASTSDGRWSQGDASAFGTGTMNKTVVNDTGYVVLNGKRWDNFNDNSFDTSNWTKTNAVTLTVSEESQAMHLKGKSNSGSSWYCRVWVMSTFSVSNEVQATLSLSGNGGFVSGIFMYQDSNNYAGIGTQKSPEYGSSPIIITSAHVSGSQHYDSHGATNLNTHTYKVTYDGSKARLYQDNSLVDTITISLTNPKVLWTCGVRDNGDTVDAEWDDFVSEFQSPGTFTSSVFDTRMTPTELKQVDWVALTPTGTQLGVEMRSSNYSDMSSPTVWTALTDGQTSSFPTTYRYLQYRANLTSSTTYDTPALKTMTFLYRIPLVRVEVSIDDRKTWTNATGLDSWFAELQLPENSTIVWVRAVNEGGETATSSIRIEVDTTPPVGTVVINGDNDAAPDQDVTLTIKATDHYGVAKVMVDDYADFPEGYWRPYTGTLSWHLPWGDGSKTVYVKFKDNCGWESEVVSDTILLDTQPPLGSIVINDGAEFTNGTQVSLALEATDLMGVDGMLVGEDPDLEGAVWRPFQQTLRLDLSHGDGEKRVYVAFRDKLGHVSLPVCDSISLDSTPPRLDVAIADGAPFTNHIDNQIGVCVVEQFRTTTIQIGESPDLETAPIRPFAPSLLWTFTEGDGPKAIYARVWDAAGNVGPVAVDTILLDTAVPIVRPIINGEATVTNSLEVWIDLEVTDGLHVTTMWLGEDPGLTDAMAAAFSTPLRWTFADGDGPKVLYARVRDAAGNDGPISSATIIVDTTPPALALTVGPNTGYTKSRSVLIELEASETGDAIWMQLGEDPTLATAPFIEFTSSIHWLLSEAEGTKALYARAMDEAGNVGAIVKAVTVLDMTPPTFAFSIAGGARFTSVRSVTVQAEATDSIGVLDMMLGDSPSVEGMTPLGSTDPRYLLPGPDGIKFVYGSSIDRAGNIASVVSVSIILDTTAPVCEVRTIQPIAGTAGLRVTWSSSDSLSGPQGVDIQSRDGDGPWKDWLSGTKATEAVFEGVDGHTYSFRARATDAAGNLGTYPDDVQNAVEVLIPSPTLPLVEIMHPSSNAAVKGSIFVSGTALHRGPGKTIASVKALVGENVWVEVNGTTLWSLEVDTTLMGNGHQTIKARAFDGQRYSDEVSIDIVVDNREVLEPGALSKESTITILLLLVLIAAGVTVSYYLTRRRADAKQ